jgi:hypothetical protein
VQINFNFQPVGLHYFSQNSCSKTNYAKTNKTGGNFQRQRFLSNFWADEEIFHPKVSQTRGFEIILYTFIAFQYDGFYLQRTRQRIGEFLTRFGTRSKLDLENSARLLRRAIQMKLIVIFSSR